MKRASIGMALRRGSETLIKRGLEDGRLEAEVLLAHRLGLTKAQLYARLDYPLSQSELAGYRRSVERRAGGKPLAYIVGHKEFYGLDFHVDRRVFIPRPETELLVEKAIEVAKEIRVVRSRRSLAPTGVRARERELLKFSIADVGTGCGAIAVALALHLPEAEVYAIDSSAEALEVAASNCRRHGVEERVHLLEGALLAPLAESVDIIAANLPYVAQVEFAELSRDILDYEPLLALDGGPDGLAHIRRLLAGAGEYLEPQGAILLEIGATQRPAVVELARRHFPKATIELAKDYAGLDRVVSVRI